MARTSPVTRSTKYGSGGAPATGAYACVVAASSCHAGSGGGLAIRDSVSKEPHDPPQPRAQKVVGTGAERAPHEPRGLQRIADVRGTDLRNLRRVGIDPRTKQAIPKREHDAVVGVVVLGRGAVMDVMRAWRHKHVLAPVRPSLEVHVHPVVGQDVEEQ